MASSLTQQHHFQSFKIHDDKPFLNRATNECIETGKRYVLWSEVKKAFENIDYLQDLTDSDKQALFMINKCGELYLPLRVEHNPDEAYTVVDKDPKQTIPALARLFDLCEHLYVRLEHATKMARSIFQKIAANTRYHHKLLLEKITELDPDQVKIQVGGRSREKIKKRLKKLEQQASHWNHQNISFNMFHGVQTKWDYATSKLFIVLPSDVDSWEDKTPSTHHFRLYFLCDNRHDDLTPRNIPQHVHLANHAGYNLLRPQDFLDEYGDYVLRVLRLVKNGYTIGSYEIPPLNSAQILWKCESNVLGHHITEANITYLVDKAIAYLEEHTPPEWITEPGLTRNQSAAIKEFLDVQQGENTEGNLHRHIESDHRVTWRCQPHKQQFFDPRPLMALTTFVKDHGGDIDMQQTTVRAVLQSSDVADRFSTLLKNTQQIFNLTLKLDLRASRIYLRDLCLDVARSKAVALDIDGVTIESHPLGYVEYSENLFADNVVPDCELQLITLVNYPRSREQCLHLGNFSLQTPISLSQPARSWVELKADLEKIRSMVSLADVAADCDKATKALQSVLKKHGYPKTTLVTIHESGWGTVFSAQDDGLVELYSQDASSPKGVYTSGSIRRMTVDLKDLEFDENFFSLVQRNSSLQELNVSYRGHNVVYYIDSIVKMWHRSSSSFSLTLIDRQEDTRGRVVAQMKIRGCGSERYGDSTPGVDCMDSTPSSTQRAESEDPTRIQVSQWDCDQLSVKPTDYSATIFDTATEQHPAALNSLTLDTSELSQDGLATISKVLRRSDLNHLNMVCNPFDSKLSGPVAKVLDSARLKSLKSLVLSGSNIDGWVKLWPLSGSGAPQLIHLGIRGAGLNKQELSHASVLALHETIYPSPLVDLSFENVELQEPQDWALIAGALDPESLKTLGLCERSRAQFDSCPEAVEIYKEKFPEKGSPKVPSAKVPVMEGGVTEEPTDEPVDSSVEPVEPNVEPVESSVEPSAKANVEPVDSSVKPVEASVEPIKSSDEPVMSSVEPILRTML
ncbi:hypothetical protein BGZ81_003581 [Podila clonocystis]|nr:hypothetical protein BGZ81_003581 [Podila clonocystis]